MIVRHERSGGFAGITVTAAVDTNDLSAKETKELKERIEKAFPFDPPKKESATMPDQFNYEFVIEDDNKTRTYHATDETITDEMRALSKWLITTAQKLRS